MRPVLQDANKNPSLVPITNAEAIRHSEYQAKVNSRQTKQEYWRIAVQNSIINTTNLVNRPIRNTPTYKNGLIKSFRNSIPYRTQVANTPTKKPMNSKIEKAPAAVINPVIHKLDIVKEPVVTEEVKEPVVTEEVKEPVVPELVKEPVVIEIVKEPVVSEEVISLAQDDSTEIKLSEAEIANPTLNYSIVILNFNRPQNILNNLPKLINFDFVSEIIISNGKSETSIAYDHPKIIAHDDVKINEIHCLDLRFVRSLFCKTENIIIIDDDINIECGGTKKMLLEYEKDTTRIVGPFGRNVTKGAGIKYTTLNIYNSAEIILTKLMVFKQKMAYLFFYAKPLIEEVYINGIPYGNGEDIVFSTLSRFFYNNLNFAIEGLSIEDVGDDIYAISKAGSHMKYRLELCQFLHSNKEVIKSHLDRFIFPDENLQKTLKGEILRKNDITNYFAPKSNILVLTMSLGASRNLISLTKGSMASYANKVGADFLILDDASPLIINNLEVLNNLKCGRLQGSASYFFKALVIYSYLEFYTKILWLDDSCFVGPDTYNLFDLVEDGSIAGHGWKTDKAHQREYAFIKNCKNFELDVNKYINSGIVLYTQKTRALFSLEKITEHKALFESFYPHQSFLNYILQTNNIPIIKLDKMYNDMFLNYNYNKLRNNSVMEIDPIYVHNNKSHIFHITSWWNNRYSVLKSIETSITADKPE